MFWGMYKIIVELYPLFYVFLCSFLLHYDFVIKMLLYYIIH